MDRTDSSICLIWIGMAIVIIGRIFFDSYFIVGAIIGGSITILGLLFALTIRHSNEKQKVGSVE